MATIAQHGYLLLADISGYTAYLATVEHDHAQEILTELLGIIVDRLKTVLAVSAVDGDAVFAYAPEAKLVRGELLLELVEATTSLSEIRRRPSAAAQPARAGPAGRPMNST